MKSYRSLKKPQYHEEEADSEGTWALSYGDMITLLLSFFVIFFTTDFKKDQVQKLNQHLSLSLEGASELEGRGLRSEALEGFELEGLKTYQVDEVVVVTFGDLSFFESGSTTLNTKGLMKLKEFSEKFLPYAGNFRIAVKGFTDQRPVREIASRKFSDNLELSALRSLAAIRFLQKSGIPLRQMEIAGVGEMQSMDKILPRPEGLTESELNAMSRTIVLVIKPQKESWL